MNLYFLCPSSQALWSHICVGFWEQIVKLKGLGHCFFNVEFTRFAREYMGFFLVRWFSSTDQNIHVGLSGNQRVLRRKGELLSVLFVLMWLCDGQIPVEIDTSYSPTLHSQVCEGNCWMHKIKLE